MRKVTCQIFLNGMVTSLLFPLWTHAFLVVYFGLKEKRKKSILEMSQPFYLSFLTHGHLISTAYKAMFSYPIGFSKVACTYHVLILFF